ncbi:uncharacterized protein [Amphiura filiformis]|uniref:uncharacterized protein n=1 Tax=Amphiura filiformis TaxID=82378 RepID=UPI003B20BC52
MGLKIVYHSSIFTICLQLVFGAAVFQSYNDIPDFIAEKVDGGTRITLVRFGRVSGIETSTESEDGGEDHVISMTTNGLVLAKTDTDISLTTRTSHEINEECFLSADEETMEEFMYVFDAKFRTIDSSGIIFLMEIPGSELSEFRDGVIVDSSDSHVASDSSASHSISESDGVTMKPTVWSEWNLRHGLDNQIPLHLQDSFDRILAVTDHCMTTESKWKHVHAKFDKTGLEPGTDDTNEPNRARRAPGIYPGTVWCGLGDTASSFDDMGVHADTDACCREHDFCPNHIERFQSKFGYFNFRPYSVNLCDCDLKLRQCFRDVNTTISNSVAHLFFNVFSPVCFELEEYQTCTGRYWWGLCYQYGISLRAITRENKPWINPGSEVN